MNNNGFTPFTMPAINIPKIEIVQPTITPMVHQGGHTYNITPSGFARDVSTGQVHTVTPGGHVIR